MKKILTFFLVILFTNNLVAQNDNYLLPVWEGQINYGSSKFGYIDNTGKLVVNYIYSSANFFSEGLACVSKKINEKSYYGFINTSGKEVIGCRYDYADDFSDGLAFVEFGSQKGYINKEGKMVIKLSNNIKRCERFSEGLAIVYTNDSKNGIIDKSGNYTLNPQSNYKIGNYFSENLCPFVNVDGKCGFIDKYGNQKISVNNTCNIQWIFPFSDGLALFSLRDKQADYRLGTKYGFIDKNGTIIIEPIYSYATDFKDGISAVKYENGLAGYIDKNGNNLFENRAFIATGTFYNNRAIVVTDDNETEIIDKNGKTIKTISKELKSAYIYYLDIDERNQTLLDNQENNFHINNNGDIIWQGKGYEWCFPSNTLLTKIDGNTISIKDIKKGMQILSYNPRTQKTEFATVKELITHNNQQYHLTRITFMNSQTLYASLNNDIELLQIEGTYNHPILTTNGYKSLGNITENDKILYHSEFDNKIIECSVLQIEKNYKTVNEVYNIKLENGNSYIINNIIASPKCPYVYIKQNDIYQQIDEILKNQVSDKLDRYDYLEIPFEMIENNILLIKIAEQKDEISYLDHIYLQVGNQIIKPECEKNLLQKIQSNDNEYYQLQKGEYFELIFILPENIDKTTKIQLVAKGYYVFFNYATNR